MWFKILHGAIQTMWPFHHGVVENDVTDIYLLIYFIVFENINIFKSLSIIQKLKNTVLKLKKLNMFQHLWPKIMSVTTRTYWIFHFEISLAFLIRFRLYSYFTSQRLKKVKWRWTHINMRLRHDLKSLLLQNIDVFGKRILIFFTIIC